ncbi:MAG: MraY family glycosyltransferase [Phycisphaerales bacterium]
MTLAQGDPWPMASTATLATAALVAGVASAAGTAVSARLAQRLGLVSSPNPIVADHVRPVPYLGGVGMAIGMVTGFAALRWSAGPDVASAYGAVVGFAMLFAALGVLDDARPWTPGIKSLGQAVLATGAVLSGVHAPMFGIEIVDRVICVVWIVAIVNAFNFIDVSDGLLASAALGVCTSLAVGCPDVAPMAVVMAAVCVGFLPFNVPPARVFAGDAGSHLLGFVLAALVLHTVASDPDDALQWVTAPTMLGVAVFEGVFVTAVRIRKGLPWWRGSPDHVALRMRTLGFSRSQINAIAFAAACACGASAILLEGRSPEIVILGAAGLCGVGAIVWRWLLRAG